VRVVMARILQARQLPPREVMNGATVEPKMVALLPPGDLCLAAAALPARPTLSVLQTCIPLGTLWGSRPRLAWLLSLMRAARLETPPNKSTSVPT